MIFGIMVLDRVLYLIRHLKLKLLLHVVLCISYFIYHAQRIQSQMGKTVEVRTPSTRTSARALTLCREGAV